MEKVDRRMRLLKALRNNQDKIGTQVPQAAAVREPAKWRQEPVILITLQPRTVCAEPARKRANRRNPRPLCAARTTPPHHRSGIRRSIGQFSTKLSLCKLILWLCSLVISVMSDPSEWESGIDGDFPIHKAVTQGDYAFLWRNLDIC